MLKLTEDGKKKVFADELAMIGSDEIRNFTLQVMDTFPEHFWTQPASTTGKYHPVCTLGRGGLLVHVKRVLFFVQALIRAHRWSPGSPDSDKLLSAAILHDGQKGGKGYGTYEDYENHPLLVQSRFLSPDAPDPTEEWQIDIWLMIRYHMGPWTPKSAWKPLNNYSEPQLILYYADYLAAQKYITTPVDGAIEKMGLVYEEESPSFDDGEDPDPDAGDK